MPASLVHNGKWEEPCQLFISSNQPYNPVRSNEENHSSNRFSSLFSKVQGLIGGSSSSSLGPGNTYQKSEYVDNAIKGSDEDKRYSFAKIWGLSKESHKWDKKRVISLKRERFETQKITFKCYMKFWIENIFKLRGLEINMIFIAVNAGRIQGFSLTTARNAGTLEYDVLHLGYLGFALVFFRMRLEILKKKNKIFKYLRMYNFALIVLSLAYQSPYVGQFSSGMCDQIDYLYEIIGFYKYDYGFKITSRSAFVEIVIFLLVSVQSYIFSSGEFDYVSRYLEAEQIGAMVREQEKKALKKTEQLQHLRRSEEHKRQRNMQVERMKSEMYNLQSQLNRMSSFTPINDVPHNEGLRRRRNTKLYSDTNTPHEDNRTVSPTKQDKIGSTESAQSFEFSVTDTQKNMRDLMFQGSTDTMRSPIRGRSDEFVLTDNIRNSLGSTDEITELEDSDDKVNYSLSKWEKARGQPKETH
ncbi:hypothetical protein HU200_060840 [Digitaria exilis]|uniref:Uncharacterized protein n=1 Tax=Digitaria exilis TaxID=1010633 RepID=A0A835A8F0_9POAL|nr:hypothetical protein HU200_060840 [Digitaria exilis]